MVIVYSCLLYIVFLCFVLFSLSFFVEFFLYMNKILPTLVAQSIRAHKCICKICMLHKFATTHSNFENIDYFRHASS